MADDADKFADLLNQMAAPVAKAIVDGAKDVATAFTLSGMFHMALAEAIQAAMEEKF